MPELVFSVDSALLSELGERLVESAHVALVELVKNAYDADATEVTIRIIPQEGAGPEIHVIDNGAGMTFKDVKSYWMRIATTHKVAANVSPRFGRPRTGSKGIGRFSCRRLGTRLQLESVAEQGEGFQRTQVNFDWTRFQSGKNITSVRCQGTQQRLQEAETGTSLLISGSKTDDWSKRGYDFVKRQLAVLAASRGRKRKGYEEDPGFRIHLEAEDFEGEVTDLREDLLKSGWGDLKVRVNNQGIVKYSLEAKGLQVKPVEHPDSFRHLAGTCAHIAIMPNERKDMRDTGVLSKSTLSDILQEWGGVFVRYRGFRVYPYGEPGDDWLRIERDRAIRKGSVSKLLQPFAARLRGVNPQRALLSLLSNRSYIGDVEIGAESSGFVMKASREGFIDDAGIESLREVVRFGIDWSTIHRDHAIARNEREAAVRARELLAKHTDQNVAPHKVVSAAINVVNSEVRTLARQLPIAERQQVLRSLRTATQAIKKHEASNQEERRHLQLVASTSTLLLIFSHEVKSLLGWLEQVAITLDQIGKTLKGSAARSVYTLRDDFGNTKQRFLDLLSMTSLISVTSPGEQAHRLALRPRLERAAQCFSLITNAYDIEVDLDGVSRSHKVGPILEAELYAVLLNVLSNAIKSVIASGSERRLLMTSQRQAGKVALRISDSGLGISQDHYESVFTPFVADPDRQLYKGLESRLNPEDQYIVGTGSGLGLSISREIVGSRDGAIHFVEPVEGWSATIEVLLP